MNSECISIFFSIVITLFFFALCYFFAQILPGFSTTIRVSEWGVEVWEGIVPVARIRYEDILEIRPVTFKEMLPWHNRQAINWYRAGGKFYVPKAVLVQKRKGIIKFVVISPEDVDAFIREVKRKMSSEKQ